jgi:hypothetical protein
MMSRQPWVLLLSFIQRDILSLIARLSALGHAGSPTPHENSAGMSTLTTPSKADKVHSLAKLQYFKAAHT